MSVLYCIAASIIQALAGTIIALKISNIKIEKNSKLILKIYLLNLVYLTLSGTIIPQNLRFFFSLILLSLIYYFIIDKQIKKSLIKAVVTMILLSISEIVCSGLLYIFISDMHHIGNVWYFNLLLVVMIVITSILLCLILKNKLLKIIDKFKNVNIIYFCVILIIIYFIVAKNALYIKLDFDIVINLIILISSILLFILIMIKELKNNQLKDINQQMLNYVIKYEKIITEQGKANHEFKNQLMVIRGYAQMNSHKLIEYIDSIVKDTRKTSGYLISQLNKFPDGGIKGLLYYKLSVMEDEQIKYDINVETGVKFKLNTLDINMYKNVTKILGVLLDNAIDACKHIKNKKIIILVKQEKNRVIFSIYNTYNGKINLSKIGSGYTTKGKGHGYGLKLVKDIVDNNKIFSVDKFFENEYYVSRLTIKIYKKNKNEKAI